MTTNPTDSNFPFLAAAANRVNSDPALAEFSEIFKEYLTDDESNTEYTSHSQFVQHLSDFFMWVYLASTTELIEWARDIQAQDIEIERIRNAENYIPFEFIEF